MQLVSVDPRWSGQPAIVAATGPSLTADVIERCRGQFVIAVNDAMRVMPWAAVGYACDAAWWIHYDGCPDFAGERWTSHSLSPKNDKADIAGRYPLKIVRGEESSGFSADPTVIHYGNNSGFQAVNLALLFGADPIVLVGFDMRTVDRMHHFFGNHPSPLRTSSVYQQWIARFELAAKMMPNRGRIINATPGSALKCFPMVDLADTLAQREAA